MQQSNRSFFKVTFHYNDTVRQIYIDMFKNNFSLAEDNSIRENRLTLSKYTLHIIGTEDSRINYSINNLTDPIRPFPYCQYDNWRSITYYIRKVISYATHFITTNVKIKMNILKPGFRRKNDGISQKTVVRITFSFNN